MSRAEHEATVASLREMRDQVNHWRSLSGTYASRESMERDRFDTLLDKYHALKLQGAAIAEPRPVLPVREPDPISDAVMLASGTNQALRKHLMEYARKQRGQDVAPAVIADAIVNWTPADDGSDIAE